MDSKTITFVEISNTVLEDKATGGKCYNCYMTVRQYVHLVERIYEKSNEFQRRIINIKKSLIYQKLVRDLLRGVVIPTISLFFDDVCEVRDEMEILDNNIQILDGLQRTNCIIYALKLLRNEIKDELNILSDVNVLQEEEFLDNIKIRFEIWTNLTVNGVLYKMVSLNAGQTPMDLEHQFEVLELPLKNELAQSKGITIYTKDEDKTRRENYGFNISNLVEGLIAYNTESIFPRKQATAISIMDSLEIKNSQRESSFIKNDYLMNDLIWVIDKLHNTQIERYSDEALLKFKGIMADSDVFFIPFMAALGKARKELSEENFEKKKERLIKLLDEDLLDPWGLMQFEFITSTDKLKSNIGLKRRKIVFYTFLMFFTTVDKLDWNLGSNFM